jgi:iron complex outermembrane receptor protein
MGHRMSSRLEPYIVLAVATVLTAPALAQQASSATTSSSASASSDLDRLPELIVTAQKRSQSINDVGFTIQALTGDALANRGIQGPEDLGKVVPGLSFTKSIFGTPVYTLRGVGLYDATFGAVPAVAIYTDQVPRNFPVMAAALDLDIERVEVLKGPQGTLFGQSSTGGAVNYIVNKPTRDFESGVDFSYERFDKETFSGYLSGPVTDTLGARIAVRAIEGGAWQYSASRPSDELGNTRKLESRFTLDWKPSDKLTVENMFTAARDRSDPQAPQLVTNLLDIYSAAALATANANPVTRNPYGIVNNGEYALLTIPGSPAYDVTFLGRQSGVVARLNGAFPGAPSVAAGALGLLSATNPGDTSRVAEWTQGLLGPSNNSYFQDSLRLDYKINDAMSVTSVSAYAYQKIDYNESLDGTTARDGNISLFGWVETFNQELRLSGSTDRAIWMVGATFDNDRTVQDNYYILQDYSQNAYGSIPCAANASYNPNACKGGPYAYLNTTENDFASTLKTYAGFTNVDYKITPKLSAQMGARFTQNDQTATYCYNDPAFDLNQGAAFVFAAALESPPFGTGPILPGQCFPIGDGKLGTIKGAPVIRRVTPKLNENNFSFRAGLNYKLDQGGLVYLTVDQGYKAGLFSEIGASETGQYSPATQEKLIDYEAGIKLPFFDYRVHLNTAVFYYDYTNKQVRARIQDPVFGLLEKMINVPKSYVAGAEFDLTALPFRGLTLRLAGTYLYSEVTSHFAQTPDGFPVYNAEGITGDFKDSGLPYTPKFSGNADAEYEWNWGGQWAPFVGATETFQTNQNTTFTSSSLPAPDFNIAGYALLDVRAGVRAADDKWQIMAYCHNATDKFYVTSISEYLDTRTRYTGQPAVYGVSFRERF